MLSASEINHIGGGEKYRCPKWIQDGDVTKKVRFQCSVEMSYFLTNHSANKSMVTLLFTRGKEEKLPYLSRLNKQGIPSLKVR